MKKFALFLTICFLSISNVYAENENIYDMPRVPPKTPIFDSYGKSYNLTSFKGEFVVAVFWSRYCAPCLKEMDDLGNFAKQTEYDGIKVILISPEAEWSSAESRRKVLEKYGAGNIEDFVDKKGDLASDMGIYRTPHTVLLNVKGEEIGRIGGSADWDSDKIVEYIYKIKADSNNYLKENANKVRDILGTKTSIKVNEI